MNPISLGLRSEPQRRSLDCVEVLGLWEGNTYLLFIGVGLEDLGGFSLREGEPFKWMSLAYCGGVGVFLRVYNMGLLEYVTGLRTHFYWKSGSIDTQKTHLKTKIRPFITKNQEKP